MQQLMSSMRVSIIIECSVIDYLVIFMFLNEKKKCNFVQE